MAIKLRDHPLLSYRKVCSWPPFWVFLYPPANESPIRRDTTSLQGEVGILKEVRRWDLREHKCFLYIEHENSTYLGCLFVQDSAFCQRLYELLRGCCGRPIKEIGDMDVSHAL